MKVEIQKKGMNMKLVFDLRQQGQSEWNALNLFTGWATELTDKGWEKPIREEYAH